MKRLLRKAETALPLETYNPEEVADQLFEQMENTGANIYLQTDSNGGISVSFYVELPLNSQQIDYLSDSNNLTYVGTFVPMVVGEGNVKVDYDQNDPNAGYFAVLSKDVDKMLPYVVGNGGQGYLDGSDYLYEINVAYPSIEQFAQTTSTTDYLQEYSNMAEVPTLAAFLPVSFQDMTEEKFNEISKRHYFGTNKVSYQDVVGTMEKVERDVDEVVALVPSMLEAPPLYWANMDDDSSVAYSSALMRDGLSGMAVNSMGPIFKESDKDLLSLIAHELAHEIDGQNDLTALFSNDKGVMQGDETLIDYLSDKAHVDHDFSAWEGFYPQDKEIQYKLREAFADLFAQWAVGHVYGGTLKGHSKDVMDYLDYLFGYMNSPTSAKRKYLLQRQA